MKYTPENREVIDGKRTPRGRMEVDMLLDYLNFEIFTLNITLADLRSRRDFAKQRKVEIG